eukprot:gene23704-28723_t
METVPILQDLTHTAELDEVSCTENQNVENSQKTLEIYVTSMAHADHAISFDTCTDVTEIRGNAQACVKNELCTNLGKREDRAAAEGVTDSAMDESPVNVQESEAHGHTNLDEDYPGLSVEGAISHKSERVAQAGIHDIADVVRKDDSSLMAQVEGVQVRQLRLAVEGSY